MEAKIISFRRGRHTQKTNQFILLVEGVDSKDKAEKFIGKKIYWESPSGKKINGIITNTHGSKGLVRARFEKGLPGEVIGKTVNFV